MKKSNMMTFLSLMIVIGLVLLYMLIFESPEKAANEDTTVSASATVQVTTKPVVTLITANPSTPVNISMSDALFIGDSRTVGIKEYAGIEDADFFCTVGLGLHNYQKTSITTDEFKDITLVQLLTQKKYGKVYISMGVNDLGYEYDSTMNLYKDFLDLIKSKQPEAKIFIVSNLHVAHDRSQRDEVVNNTAINKFNSHTAQFADNRTVFYLDSNCLYDDSNGGLATDKTGDNTHLYAKYYKQWGEWIISQTAAVTGATN